MRIAAMLATAAAALALAAADAAAQSARNAPIQGRLSLNPTVGTDFDLKEKEFTRAATQDVTATGTVGGTAFSVGATFTTTKKDFSDVYDRPLVLGVDLSYGLSDRSEVFGVLGYTWASARTFDAISVNAAGTFGGVPIAANGTVQGKLSNFHQVGIEAGYRHFFPVASSLKVYASGAVGVAMVKSIDLDLSVSGTRVASGVRMFKDSWTYSLALGLGLRYDLAPGIAIGAETGLRYNTRLQGDDASFADSASYSKVNDRGDRLVVPVRVSATVTF